MSNRFRSIAMAVILPLALAMPAAQAATPKDTLVLAQTLDDLQTLDPADNYSFSSQELTANMYDRLMSIKVESFPASTIFYLGMNVSDEHFKNPKVRQAVKMLVDYDGMADSFLKGQFFVHETFLPIGFLGAIPYAPWKLDVAKAKALLAEAGYADGFEFKLITPNVPPWPQIAQSIQQTMGQGGIKLNVVQVDTKQSRATVRARKHKIFVGTWAPDYFDPQSNAIPYATNDDDDNPSNSTSYAWRMHWYIPDLTKDVAKAAKEIDTEKRKAMYEALQKKVTDDGPFAFMFQNANRIAMRADVKDFKLGLFEDLNYYRTATK